METSRCTNEIPGEGICGRPVYGRPYTLLLAGHIARHKPLCGRCLPEFVRALNVLLGKTGPAKPLEVKVRLFEDAQGRLAATEDVRAELLEWWATEPGAFTEDEARAIEALHKMLEGNPNKAGRLATESIAAWKRLRGHFRPLPADDQVAEPDASERATRPPFPREDLRADDWKLEPSASQADGWHIYESTPKNMSAVRRTLVEELYFDPAQFTDEETALIQQLPVDSADFPPVAMSLYARVVRARRRVGVPTL
ncbi:hypothetical protein [Streptomyces luteireticuli]|uniref:Uncharacterized protein n=1 Tax=Streptomyces luteireticuli TaxID=173858 RepID=A0ABN0YR94_9ACTN